MPSLSLSSRSITFRESMEHYDTGRSCSPLIVLSWEATVLSLSWGWSNQLKRDRFPWRSKERTISTFNMIHLHLKTYMWHMFASCIHYHWRGLVNVWHESRSLHQWILCKSWDCFLQEVMGCLESLHKRNKGEEVQCTHLQSDMYQLSV